MLHFPRFKPESFNSNSKHPGKPCRVQREHRAFMRAMMRQRGVIGFQRKVEWLKFDASGKAVVRHVFDVALGNSLERRMGLLA